MKTSPYYYKNIFLYASLQFCGNIEEYFRNHTENLLVFIVMPRIKNKFNILRYYQNGKLVKEEKVTSSSNIFFYYFLWYMQYLGALLKYFSKKERVVVISFHSISFFLMTIQKLLRSIAYVYWIGDYFPGVSFTLRMYEKLKKSYHNTISYSCYLSDKINKKMNGKVLQTAYRKTVVWGVKPKNLKRGMIKNHLQILFVGLIKPSQGIENILLFLKEHKEYKIKILGICEQKFYEHLKNLISEYKIKDQVYFPNAFLSDEELERESRDCHVGVALYDVSPLNATYYADPGKVKSYAELELPIIMSNISDTAKFIKKFHCGEVVEQLSDLHSALLKVKKNYKAYQLGLKKFNKHFYYESYYKKSFLFLEQLWPNKK